MRNWALLQIPSDGHAQYTTLSTARHRAVLALTLEISSAKICLTVANL